MENQGEAVELRLPPRPEYVGTARIVAGTFARHHGFGEEQIDDLKIAISEAVTNALRAHVASNSEEPVTITLSMRDDEMRVAVADQGAGIDADADLERTPAPGELEGGLGLAVIRSLFSEAMIERRPGGGTLLTISVKREAEPVSSGS